MVKVVEPSQASQFSITGHSHNIVVTKGQNHQTKCIGRFIGSEQVPASRMLKALSTARYCSIACFYFLEEMEKHTLGPSQRGFCFANGTNGSLPTNP